MKLLFASLVFIFTQITVANESQIVNVFYSAEYGNIAVNLANNDIDRNFLRTSHFIVTSLQLKELCHPECVAEIKVIDSNSFYIETGGVLIAKVEVNDVDSLLPSESFSIRDNNRALDLVLNIDHLKNKNHKYLNPKVTFLNQ